MFRSGRNKAACNGLRRFFSCVTFIALAALPASAQFSLDITSASQDFIDVFVPGGTSSRQLQAIGSDGQVREWPLIDCTSGCVVRMDSLSPATIVRFLLLRQSDTLSQVWGITSSLSSGKVETYFTTDVDSELADTLPPQGLGGAVLEAEIIRRISMANQSVDAAIYNINRREIVNALEAAHTRGVKVRYVTGDDTSNSALSNPTPSFPIIRGNSGEPLMHHKFFVIDAEMPEYAWVITGATNMTTFQLYEDHNNTVFIQDQSLARVYTMEMDEMWGGSGPQPNLALARFGSQKLNNTPHKIFINGALFESYFSPSDNTTFHIINALNRAQESAYFSLLTLTRNSLASTLINLKNRGVVVRGIIENTNDTGSEFDRLVSNGVFVLPHNPDPQLHHKYAIIDPNHPSGRSQLITGSHNWTNNAEQNNDENTLIIHDQSLARIFFSEFQSRWCEVFPSGGNGCRLTVSSNLSFHPLAVEDKKVKLHLSDRKLTVFNLSVHTCLVAIYSVDGRLIYSTNAKHTEAGTPFIIEIPALLPGMYTIVFANQNGQSQKSSMLVY
jgi:phosphatidylserine/phosphatidylglycerophosphate/cardiolipin synthase-like enzyme